MVVFMWGNNYPEVWEHNNKPISFNKEIVSRVKCDTVRSRVVKVKERRCATWLHFQAVFFSTQTWTWQQGLSSHCRRWHVQKWSFINASKQARDWQRRGLWRGCWVSSPTIALIVERCKNGSRFLGVLPTWEVLWRATTGCQCFTQTPAAGYAAQSEAC